MEKSSNASRRNNRGMEENTMAILDASGVKDTQDANDDMMAFLEAVRLSSLVPENGTAPTRYAEYGFKSISLSIFVF